MAALVRISRPFRQTTCCVCSQLPGFGCQRSNSNRASVTKIKTPNYVRKYPTFLILPDGSSITIRYEKPRMILKLPVDVSTLSPKEIENRKLVFSPPKKIHVKKEIEDTYDLSRYTSMIKKKKR